MKYLLLADVNIPKEYEHLLNAKMPMQSILYPIVGLVLVLIATIIIAVVVGKKHGYQLLPLFTGATVFMFFNYFLVGIISMFVPAGSTAVYLIVVSLLTAFVPFMGRLFFIKLFAKKHNTLKDHLGYGVSFVGMRAVMNILTFVYPIANYAQLKSNGVAYYFPADAKAEDALEMAKTIEEILNTNYTYYMLLALVTIALVVYGFAVSVPIYVAFRNKKSKAWYAFALGTGAVISVAEVLFSNNLYAIPAIIVAIITAIVTAYFAIKLYNELMTEESEESEDSKEDKKNEGSISKNAHVKIPRFSNLDKL